MPSPGHGGLDDGFSPMRLVRRIRAILTGAAGDREMDEEMRFHLDMETADGVRRGLPADEARRRAVHRFGAPQRIREEGRDARGVGPVRDLGGDLRFGLRMLRRSPVFAAVAVLTLALGIGANTAIFSVVNAVVLRPLPFPDTRTLVSVWDGGRSVAEFVGVRDRTRTLASTAAYLPGYAVSLAGDGEPVRLTSALVTSAFFDVLGVQPRVGRFFRPGDDAPGAEPGVVLSHALWRDRFGGEPSVIGRRVDVDGVARTVVGVAGAGFNFPSRETRLWIPLPVDPAKSGPHWGAYGHYVIGRLAPGNSPAQVREDVQRIATELQRDNPVWRPKLPDYLEGITVTDLQTRLVGNSQRLLFVLLGAVGLVLLLACANVANLLMVRGATRARELAIRAALGAGTGRLARQLLVENLVLAAAGGAAGLLLAVVGIRVLGGLLPADTPRLETVGLDGWAFAFTALLTLLTGVLFGVAPARRLARGDAAAGLAGGRASAGGRQRRLAGTLVSAQIAIAVVLAIGAGLLVRSLARILDVDPGFAAAKVVTAQVSPPRARYIADDQQRALVRELVARLAAAPGLSSSAVTTQLPFDQTNQVMAMWIDGWTTDPNVLDVFEVRRVSADFFRTMGIAVKRGRSFEAGDVATAPAVAIVSESAARRFWPGREATGGRLRFPWPGWLEVVGVVADVRNNDLRTEATPTLYVPFEQNPELPITVVARGDGEPSQVLAAIRAVVADVARDAPVSNEGTMDALIERSLSTPRAAALLLLSFGALALVLGSVGTYGLVAYGVESRRREFAVRLAIGAGGGTVMRMVLRDGLRLAAVGIVAGVAGAFALSGLLRGLLFEVAPTDPLAFVVAPALLLATAVVACLVPAYRATRVDPNVALRRD